MENAAEALRMAGGVLIFVLALTISINAFSQSRQGIDNLVLYSDREFLSTYVEQNEGTKRIVGTESIVPTIYRAYKENIKINFIFSNNQESDTSIAPLYTVSSYGSDENEKIFSIDLSTQTNGSEKQKEFFLYNILFGTGIKGNGKLYTDDEYDDNMKSFKTIIFNPDGLYKRLTNGDLRGTYEESLGVYFLNQGDGTTDKSTTNKTEKKVITYQKK